MLLVDGTLTQELVGDLEGAHAPKAGQGIHTPQLTGRACCCVDRHCAEELVPLVQESAGGGRMEFISSGEA